MRPASIHSTLTYRDKVYHVYNFGQSLHFRVEMETAIMGWNGEHQRRNVPPGTPRYRKICEVYEAQSKGERDVEKEMGRA